MISEKTVRGKAAEVIFSYLPTVLQSLTTRVTRQEHKSSENRFTGLIEGVQERNEDIRVSIKIDGKEEPWSQVAGGFIPRIHTSRLIVETFKITDGGVEDSKESLELLTELDRKLRLYLWHTAG